MAATYHNITAEEMDAFLTKWGFKPVVVEGTHEKVYPKRVDQDNLQLSLRVYTGIVGDSSRGVGEDAIRVSLFLRLVENGEARVVKLGGSKRVHRVKNWQKNLTSRIENWLEFLPTEACDKCGMPMIPRKGTYGMFLGCVAYPNCNNTRKIQSKD